MKWTVFFDEPDSKPQNNYEIFIRPTQTGWNDFTYNYRATAKIKHPNKTLNIDLFIVPLINNAIQKSISTAIEKNFTNAFSLLARKSFYNELAHTLTLEEFKSLLECINDLSYINHTNKRSEQFDKIISSENFRLGVLRSASAFDAFLYGYKKSFNIEPMLDARAEFDITVKLPGCHLQTTLPIKYKNHQHFQDRVHCLIGTNGVGKTQLLQGLILAAAKDFHNREKKSPKACFCDGEGNPLNHESATINFEYGFHGFRRIVAYTSDSESALPRQVNSISGLDYTLFNTNKETTEFSYDKHLTYLLASLYRDDYFAGLDKWKILESALSSIAPISRLMIPVQERFSESIFVQDKNGNKWVLLREIRGEQRTLDIFGMIDPSRDLCFASETNGQPIKLSSGQRSFFKFTLHFLKNAGVGTLLLIDEPETHLHPNLISEYMILLYKILEETRSVAIIATHSAYIAREVPTHCTHIMKRNNEHAYFENVYMNTLGANISDLSMAVFGDSTVTNYHQKISSEIARSGLSLDTVIDKYKDILSLDMLVEIRSQIEGAE